MIQNIKHKCGDLREDGMVFWSYGPLHKNGEYWVSAEKFAQKKEKSKEIAKRSRIRNPEREKERGKRYRQKHKEALAVKRKTEREKNKDYHKQYQSEWRKRNPQSSKNTQLKKNFGITIDKYNELLNFQKGVCKICSCKCSSGKSLAVDHCHKSGVIRGLLCGNCNKALGLFKDSSEVVQKAFEYIKQFEV